MAQTDRTALKKLKRIIHEPLYVWNLLVAVLRGSYYILFYRMFRKNVKIRFPFKAFARVTIAGPGDVFIDSNCSVIMTLFRGLTIVTLTPQAKVRIGKNGHLGGMTIRSAESVLIGEEIRTAAALVQDVILINGPKEVNTTTKRNWLESKPIVIGDNVWLAGQSVTLGGCKIGNDSVIGGGAACIGAEIGEAHVVFGNPGKRPLPIARLLQLKGEI